MEARPQNRISLRPESRVPRCDRRGAGVSRQADRELERQWPFTAHEVVDQRINRAIEVTQAVGD